MCDKEMFMQVFFSISVRALQMIYDSNKEKSETIIFQNCTTVKSDFNVT
jgi:hypothetical protein